MRLRASRESMRAYGTQRRVEDSAPSTREASLISLSYPLSIFPIVDPGSLSPHVCNIIIITFFFPSTHRMPLDAPISRGSDEGAARQVDGR